MNQQKSRRQSYAGQPCCNGVFLPGQVTTVPSHHIITDTLPPSGSVLSSPGLKRVSTLPGGVSNYHVTSNGVGGGVNNCTNSSSSTTVDSLQMYRLDMSSHRSSNPSRRTSRVEDSFACSQQSILSAMDRFVKSVSNMEATVLVPSRLRDMDVTGRSSPPPNLLNTDLHSFYNMLNDVKNELLWGPGSGAAAVITAVAAAPLINPMLRAPSVRALPSVVASKQHQRQPSDDSLGSTGSHSDTDSNSDSQSLTDSSMMVTDRESMEQSLHLAAAFRHHLQGLHTILHQLADAANYLAARYQEEVDASNL